jgi:hypothetical protein
MPYLCGAGNDTIGAVTEGTGSVFSRSEGVAALPWGAPRLRARSARARSVRLVPAPSEPVP